MVQSVIENLIKLIQVWPMGASISSSGRFIHFEQHSCFTNIFLLFQNYIQTAEGIQHFSINTKNIANHRLLTKQSLFPTRTSPPYIKHHSPHLPLKTPFRPFKTQPHQNIKNQSSPVNFLTNLRPILKYATFSFLVNFFCIEMINRNSHSINLLKRVLKILASSSPKRCVRDMDSIKAGLMQLWHPWMYYFILEMQESTRAEVQGECWF